MSAEAAIYPTSLSLSNRFFQNFLTFSPRPARRLSAEPAASKEVTGASQATFSKKKRCSSGWKYLEALSNYSAFPRSAASIETEFLGQPNFSFLLPFPTRPVLSTKTAVGAPEERRELEEIRLRLGNLAIHVAKRKPREAQVPVRGARPRSEGRLLGPLSRGGKREIGVSSPPDGIACA